MAELAKASNVDPRDPGLNHGIDRKHLFGLFVPQLNSNLWGIHSSAKFVNLYIDQ
jgi:hypothetical protein